MSNGPSGPSQAEDENTLFDDSSSSKGGEKEQLESATVVGVTWYRWVILAIFSIENLVNSIMWICFGISPFIHHFQYTLIYLLCSSNTNNNY